MNRLTPTVLVTIAALVTASDLAANDIPLFTDFVSLSKSVCPKLTRASASISKRQSLIPENVASHVAQAIARASEIALVEKLSEEQGEGANQIERQLREKLNLDDFASELVRRIYDREVSWRDSLPEYSEWRDVLSAQGEPKHPQCAWANGACLNILSGVFMTEGPLSKAPNDLANEFRIWASRVIHTVAADIAPDDAALLESVLSPQKSCEAKLSDLVP